MVAYVLSDPLIIGSRLLPTLPLSDGGYVSVEMTAVHDDGRTDWRYHIDVPGATYTSEATGVSLSPMSFPEAITATPEDFGRMAGEAIAIVAESLDYRSSAESAPEWLPSAVAAWVDAHDWNVSCATDMVRGAFDPDWQNA